MSGYTGRRTYGMRFQERSTKAQGWTAFCLFCAARVPVETYTSTADGATTQVTTYNCSDCGTYRKQGKEITRMPRLNGEQIKILREAMNAKGLKTTVFADECKIPKSSLHGGLKGEAISEAHVATIVRALGVEKEWTEAGFELSSFRPKRPPDTFEGMAAKKGLAAPSPSVSFDFGPGPLLGATPTVEVTVDHPSHYGGPGNTYEAINVIEAWQLNFCLGNAVKYIARAGKKPGSPTAVDLDKAIWYLQRERARL